MKFLRVFILLLLSMQLFAVDINSASKKELMALNGIGEKTAAAIIAYREKHLFKSIEEIQKIKGIGKKRFEAIKSEITID